MGGGSVLEGQGDLVGGDGTLTEDHPGVAASGEVDDSSGDGTGGWASIHDKGDLVAKLVADAGGIGTLWQAGEVSGGGGDREAEAGRYGAGDGCLRDAQGEIAGVGGYAQGQLTAGLDDDGEGAGPEPLRQAVEGGVQGAGQLVGLLDLGDEQGEGLMTGAGLDVVDAVDGVEIDGIDGQAVEGVGRQGDNVAGVQAVDDDVDEFGFGLVGMDVKGFGRQMSRSCELRWRVPPSPRHLLLKVFHPNGLGLDFDTDIRCSAGKVFERKNLTHPAPARGFAGWCCIECHSNG
jgi:hypothetical protein